MKDCCFFGWRKVDTNEDIRSAGPSQSRAKNVVQEKVVISKLESAVKETNVVKKKRTEKLAGTNWTPNHFCELALN